MVKEDILISKFNKTFNEMPEFLIDTGGRFEICGNHTDHNHGLCLVANCSLRIKGAVKKSDDVEILSKGYDLISFSLKDLKPKVNERNTTLALAKGVIAHLKELGYKVGGFKIYIESEIPDGSGVSSSAAIESLFGYTISYLYNDGKIEPLVIAKTGQFSENNYFYKPCGLLDQVGTSFDSSNFIDFKNIDNPVIETLPFKLPVTLYLIKSLGNHSNLTPLYAAIPDSMKEVATLLEGKSFLRDISDTTNIFERIDDLEIDESKKRKAKHFFIENENVKIAKSAIEENDLELFFKAIRQSQNSSYKNLENTFVKGEYSGSPQEIIDNVTEFLGNNGAIRIHGGGFKGTTLAFVKNDFTKEFDEYLKSKYSPDRYFKVSISEKAVHFKRV